MPTRSAKSSQSGIHQGKALSAATSIIGAGIVATPAVPGMGGIGMGGVTTGPGGGGGGVRRRSASPRRKSWSTPSGGSGRSSRVPQLTSTGSSAAPSPVRTA